MKKIVHLFLVCIFLLCIPFTSVASNIDFSSLTDEDLVAFIDSAQAELNRRGASDRSESNVTVTLGSIVTFGRYMQDKGGKEASPIEWIVLDIIGNKCLLLSRYVLDTRQFHTSRTNVSWEDCSLRKWLNQDFVEIAFNENEIQAIVVSDISNATNEGVQWGLEGSNDTQDRIFLLSYKECQTYFTESDEWYVIPTAYAKARGVFSSMENEKCAWWLRSPGKFEQTVLTVDEVNPDDHVMNSLVDNDNDGIRPALWLDLTLVSN